ncbi:MAG TPA: hypothetical protein VHU44_17520 [Acidobacteriaceae bacterium]|nr:hypothetical protein [Acidobacteriaceae bacterium]
MSRRRWSAAERLHFRGRLVAGEFGGPALWGDGGGGFVGEGGGVGVGFADDGLWLGDGIEAAGVGRGEVEAVEDGASVLEVDLVGGDGVDDFGDGDLDGDGVFERAEVEDGSAALEVGTGDDGGAVDTVGVVESAVEVAEGAVLEGDGLALESVGADVAAEFDLHGVPLFLSTGVCVGCG